MQRFAIAAWSLASVVTMATGSGCLGTEGGEGGVRCGDTELDPSNETCDDGNNVDGDGCSATCLLETTLLVRWPIEDAAGNPASCPAPTDTIRVSHGVQGFQHTLDAPCTQGEVSFVTLRVTHPKGESVGIHVQLLRGDTEEVIAAPVPRGFKLTGGVVEALFLVKLPPP